MLNADQPEFASLAAVCRARGIAVLDYGRRAERLRLARAGAGCRRPGSSSSPSMAGRIGRASAGRRLPGRQRARGAGAGGGVRRRSARLRSRTLLRAARRARPARADRRPSRAARRCSSTTPTSRTRSTRSWTRCARTPPAAWSRCSAAAATAIRASAPRWARSPPARPTACSSPTTTRAARSRRRSAARSWRPARAPSRSATGARRSAPRVAELAAGDVLVVAGKGHESGQIVGDRVLPFDDATEVAGRAGRAGRGRGMTPRCWTAAELAAATGGRAHGDWSVVGVSIDSRTRAAGRAVRRAARAASRRPRLRRRSPGARRRGAGRPRPGWPQPDAPLRRGRRHHGGADRARPRRARAQPRTHRRDHRQRRQDRHQGGAAPGALGARRRPTPAPRATTTTGACRSSLARAAARRGLRRLRARHERARRDRGARPPGPAAGRDDHHGRAGAPRLLPLGRGDRGRQGRDLRGPGAGRRRGPEPRQSALRAARRAWRRRPAAPA